MDANANMVVPGPADAKRVTRERGDGRRATTTQEADGTGQPHPQLPPFVSILFADGRPAAPVDNAPTPDYFGDLHLNDIVASLTAGRSEYDLAPFFVVALSDVAAIGYRHEVFRDLQEPHVLELVRTFAASLRAVRAQLDRAAKSHYVYERERWFLDAVGGYCAAVRALASALDVAAVTSNGLRSFREHVVAYVASSAFQVLDRDVAEVIDALGRIAYRLVIDGPKITVSRFGDEPDYGAEILATFEKFRQGVTKEYLFELRISSDMNHVEAEIVNRVALLFPDVFASLDQFCNRYADFIDPTIGRFDREIQFYVAYLEHMAAIGRANLPFCYPEMRADSQEIFGRDVFDLALAGTLVAERSEVITNDFHLEGEERILVVSGPNQGGKTTFARTIGQLHHLGRLGTPVPGQAARLYLVDRIFTHWERQEDVEDLRSKLENDLQRIHAILDAATSDSLLVMNESFSSTTLDDQLFINRQILGIVIERGMLCVAVTFLDELASMDPSVVSMMSTVDPDEPARRTFRIVRRPADGLAYALAIAEKHRVTHGQLIARLPR